MALRGAVRSHERLAGPDGLCAVATSRRVELLVPARPSVAEIAARLTNPLILR
ncbi:MAG: hypothetical protein ACRDRZ_06985 [Pseudonocardiaceae bacterium]